MRPISYVKAHPMATVVTAALGMMVGPWVLGTISGATGLSLRLPRVGG